jgi:hypothetical protein
MILRALTTRLLDRHLAPRLTRLIPHPGVRAIATLAASILVPFVVERLLTRPAGAVARRVALPSPRAT